jgi:hypothetical protein
LEDVSYCEDSEVNYSKINKNYLVFSFFRSFTHHFQIKLSTYDSNLNSIFVIMSELKFFLLMEILTQIFNTMDCVKFLEKNQKLQIQIVAITLKMRSYETMRKK